MVVSRFGGGLARIGVVGPAEVIEQVVSVADESPRGGAGARFGIKSATYVRESDIATAVRKVSPDVDALLFTGPLSRDVAREAGVLDRPAAYIGVSGSSLYGALLRAREHLGSDLTRVSIDSVSEEEVAEAYADLELPVDRVAVLPYTSPESARTFVEFHLDHHRRGTASVALTTVGAVASSLAEAGVPVVRVRPTRAAVRAALRTATLLAAGSVLEEAQIAVMLIELGEAVRGREGGMSDWWLGQDLRMAAVRVLSFDLAAVGATIVPSADAPLVVLATHGAVADLTSGFTRADFAARVQEATGRQPSVGIGLGDTAVDAEAHAREALREAQTQGPLVQVVMRDGSRVGLQADAPGRGPRPAVVDERLVAQADALTSALATAGAARSLIDAETVARLLEVTTRSARRLLQDLTRAGLAWQLPPQPQSSPGRPRQTYRLLGEDVSSRHRA